MTLNAPALAQGLRQSVPARAHDGDQFYPFDDDLLTAGAGSPYGDTLKVRPPPKRVLLIRPRTTFVQEMLKSVEDI
jgi:hypothetical protein